MRSEQVRQALTDPSYEVPAVPGDAPPGTLGWLRATVARFSTGDAHHRRRELAIRLLDAIDPEKLRAASGATPVEVLAEALGVRASVETVAAIAAAYHPHLPAGPEQDAAVARLVDACGGVADEETAARIGLLVQSHAATTALINNARGRATDPDVAVVRALEEAPPVPATRRVHAGETVELDLRGLPFGAGPHACPGRDHAIAIAAGILAREANQ
jgi:hypothetical protein